MLDSCHLIQLTSSDRQAYLIFDYLIFFHSMSDPDPNPVLELEP
jgi:hypothetical protein